MSIKEVAKIAGVSHTTVSRVINGVAGVSPSSLKRVNNAMRQLNYAPPAIRRGPQPKRRGPVKTGNVGVLMFTNSGVMTAAPFVAVVVRAIEVALMDAGLNMIVAHVDEGGRVPPHVAAGRVDGLLLQGLPPSLEMAEQLRCHPSVWFLSPRARTGYWGDRVGPDNPKVGELAATFLHQQGHEHVAYMNVNSCHIGFEMRGNAFAGRACDLGMKMSVLANQAEQNHRIINSLSEQADHQGMLEAIGQLVDMADRPTGIFVPRASLMAKVYRMLEQRGIKPGKDIQLITCDHHNLLESLDPIPTTIDIKPQLIGQNAVRQLLWRMKNPHEPITNDIRIEPCLIHPDDGRLPVSVMYE